MARDEEVGIRLSVKDRREAAKALRATERDIEGVGDASARTDRKSKRSFRSMGRNVALFGAAAFAAAGVAGKALYSVGAVFDDVKDTIRVGTGATGADLEALNSSAQRIGTQIPATFEDIGTAVADVNTRLGLTGPNLEAFTKRVLEAGRLTGEQLDIGNLSGAMNLFEVRGKRTSRELDNLYRISQATGMTINELTSSVSRNGANLKQYGFSLADSAALIGTLDKAGMDSNKTLATLSRAMVEFADAGRDPRTALEETISSIEDYTKAGNDAAAINLAAEIFGTRGASQFVAAVKAGAVNMDDLMGATGATSDTIMKASADTADFAEKWQVFKNKVLVKIEPLATRVFNAMGDGIERVDIDALFGKVETFVEYLRNPVLPTIRDVVDWFRRNQDVIVILAGGLAAGVLAYKAYTLAVKGYVAVTKVATLVTKLFDKTMKRTTIGLIVGAVIGLATALVLAYKRSERFRAIVDKVWDVLKGAGKFIAGAFVGYLKKVGGGFLTLGIFGVRAFRLLLTAAFKTFGGILSAAEKGLGWIPGIGDKVKGAKRAFDRFGDGVIDKLQGVEDKLVTTRDKLDGVAKDRKAKIDIKINVTGLNDAVRNVQRGLSPLGALNPLAGLNLPTDTENVPGRASGGPVTAGRPYVVGERRPELFVPESSGYILPRVPSFAGDELDRELEEMLGGAGGPGDVHVYIDGEEIQHRVVRRFENAGARS